MKLRSFKSCTPISDSMHNSHTTKEDIINRHVEPLTLACMFGDFGTWQCSHMVKI